VTIDSVSLSIGMLSVTIHVDSLFSTVIHVKLLFYLTTLQKGKKMKN